MARRNTSTTHNTPFHPHPHPHLHPHPHATRTHLRGIGRAPALGDPVLRRRRPSSSTAAGVGKLNTENTEPARARTDRWRRASDRQLRQRPTVTATNTRKWQRRFATHRGRSFLSLAATCWCHRYPPPACRVGGSPSAAPRGTTCTTLSPKHSGMLGPPRVARTRRTARASLGSAIVARYWCSMRRRTFFWNSSDLPLMGATSFTLNMIIATTMMHAMLTTVRLKLMAPARSRSMASSRAPVSSSPTSAYALDSGREKRRRRRNRARTSSQAYASHAQHGTWCAQPRCLTRTCRSSQQAAARMQR